MKTLLSRFAHDESGATAIEYGLIAGFVSVAALAILPLVGQNLTDVFTRINNALNQAASAP